MVTVNRSLLSKHNGAKTELRQLLPKTALRIYTLISLLTLIAAVSMVVLIALLGRLIRIWGTQQGWILNACCMRN